MAQTKHREEQKVKRQINKTDEVRKHLIKHGSITQRLAWNKKVGDRHLEASRLRGIIFNLKHRDKWEIETVDKKSKTGIPYAEYKLISYDETKQKNNRKI